MSVKLILIDASTGKALETICMPSGCKVLEVGTGAMSLGTFKTATRSTAGTTTMCSPVGDGSIVLTGLIVTAEKKAGILTLQFTDDTNTVIVAPFYLTDAPVAFSVSFGGRWQGWRSARLDMVTSIAGVVSVTLGYYKVNKKNSLAYKNWDAER